MLPYLYLGIPTCTYHILHENHVTQMDVKLPARAFLEFEKLLLSLTSCGNKNYGKKKIVYFDIVEVLEFFTGEYLG